MTPTEGSYSLPGAVILLELGFLEGHVARQANTGHLGAVGGGNDTCTKLARDVQRLRGQSVAVR